MASTTQDQLYELFAAIAGTQDATPVSPVDVADELQPASSNASSYVPPVGTDYGSGSSGSSGGGGGVESVLSDVFGSALGAMPLVSGLMSLFGGGGSTPEPLLQHYQMPAPVAFEGADVGGAIVGADYGQDGMPRLFGNGGGGGSSTTPASTTNSSGSDAGGPGGPPHINVTVQAMDAQSFMDRSSDIAAAVRSAMLNLNSINDVVNDL